MRAVPVPPDTPRVFVVEDDTQEQDGLTRLLAAAGLPTSAHASAEAFLAQHSAAMTGCAIIDVRLPGMSGVELVGALNGRANRLPIIVVSGFAQTALVVEAMRAGAVDFLEKPLDPLLVISSVRAAMRGASTVAGLRSEATAAAARLATLTPREREVFVHFSRGLSTKETAEAVDRSPKTVETHRLHLLEKFGVETHAALVRLGVLLTIYGPAEDGREGSGNP